jgi:uncharacterized protein YwgA
MSLSQDLNNKMDKSEKDMEDHHGSIAGLLKEIKIERVQISEDRKQLWRDKKEIENRVKSKVAFRPKRNHLING